MAYCSGGFPGVMSRETYYKSNYKACLKDGYDPTTGKPLEELAKKMQQTSQRSFTECMEIVHEYRRLKSLKDYSDYDFSDIMF